MLHYKNQLICLFPLIGQILHDGTIFLIYINPMILKKYLTRICSWVYIENLTAHSSFIVLFVSGFYHRRTRMDQIHRVQKQIAEVLCKKGVLNDFRKRFTEKQLCWSHFLIKLQVFRSATLLIRDTNTDVFLWILGDC